VTNTYIAISVGKKSSKNNDVAVVKRKIQWMKVKT